MMEKRGVELDDVELEIPDTIRMNETQTTPTRLRRPFRFNYLRRIEDGRTEERLNIGKVLIPKFYAQTIEFLKSTIKNDNPEHRPVIISGDELGDDFIYDKFVACHKPDYYLDIIDETLQEMGVGYEEIVEESGVFGNQLLFDDPDSDRHPVTFDDLSSDTVSQFDSHQYLLENINSLMYSGLDSELMGYTTPSGELITHYARVVE